MENVEKKDNCCEGKDKACCENKGAACEHGSMSNCCHNWKKCHMIKRIMLIVVIIIAFCLGSQWGEFKSEVRGFHYQRGGMMYGENYGNKFEQGNRVVGEVKVEVANPATPTVPAVKL